jgi:hypothetical protein
LVQAKYTVVSNFIHFNRPGFPFRALRKDFSVVKAGVGPVAETSKCRFVLNFQNRLSALRL